MNREERLMRNIRLGKVKKGFTLVELLIVIIIIAVLAAIAIPKFANSSTRSKESSLRSNLKIIRDSLELFKADTGCYPGTLVELAATTQPTGNVTTGVTSTGAACTYAGADARVPYLQAVPTDPITGATDWTYSTASPGPVAVKSSAAAPYNGW